MMQSFRWLAGACAGFLAACTHLAPMESGFLPLNGSAVPAGSVITDSRPAPRSTLLSDRELDFRLVTVARSPGPLTYLTYRDVVLGAIDFAGDTGQPRRVHWFSREAAGVPDSIREDIAALEHLYGLVLAGDPHARYALGHGMAVPQERILRRLLEIRNDAIGRLSQRHAEGVRPWHVVRLVPQSTGGHDIAAVRVVRDRGPVPGMTVSFGRAPHSGCEATSDPHGVASCELVDLHGHEGHDDHDGPVIATFVGKVTRDEVMPPTVVTIRH